MMGKRTVVFVVLVSIILMNFASSLDYGATTNNQAASSQLVVSLIKYDPSPVSAGNWFDVWIQVQNKGSGDASNVRAEVVSEYPFSGENDSAQYYDSIRGTVGAYQSGQPGDANAVVLKFRVKVADSASAGMSSLKIKVTPDYNNSDAVGIITSLPIDIEKTKSDFDVTMQDITSQGTSFIITNNGDNDASAIILNVPQQQNIQFLENLQPVVIGTLARGDFTIAHFPIIPASNANSVNLEISYTDKAGARSTVEKTIALQSGTTVQQICAENPGKSYVKWTFGAIGFLLGALLMIALWQARKH